MCATLSWCFMCFAIILCFREAICRHRNHTFRPRTVLPEHYVKEIRPPSPKGKPVSVSFSIYIVDINSINVEDMDFRVDMFIRQQWEESRLSLPSSIFEEGDDYVTLPPQFFDNLWQPDPYFINAKVVEIATLTHKFSSVTLYRNKTVQYSARMHAIIACQMEFRYYPMDIQACPIYIESFSYDNSKVRMKWTDAGVTVNPDLKLLQYDFKQPLELEEVHTYMAEKGGNFSRLVMYFRFERQIGHHLIQTFAPSSLVVVLSWFSFWLGLDAIPGRVTLLVTCMLTLVTMFTGLKSDIPPVAYVKALDLWMAGCMLFVFAALAEFVVVKVLDIRYQALKTQKAIKSELSNSSIMSQAKGNGNDLPRNRLNPTFTNIPTQRPQQVESVERKGFIHLRWVNPETGQEKILWREIDHMSCTIFPTLFLIFMIIYWPVLLLRKT